MTANELADAMGIRASIRRQATSRKSVQEGADDRLADQLEQAATMLRQQADRINVLEANHKIQLNINKKALKYIEKLEKENENLKERDRVNGLLFNQIF